MNSYLVMGLFAFHVVAVSLVRYLREDEFFRLTAMKRLWGRSRGLIFHFLANVALPMVLGIVFITQAAVHAPTARPGVRELSLRILDKTVQSEPVPPGPLGDNLSIAVKPPVPISWEALSP